MAEGGARLVVVGGGTAGWIAALMLQRHAASADMALDIVVVESSRIPTIGVGEGTTAVFRQVLMDLGIDETDFVRRTGATVKFGIRHKDWRRKGHCYDGPIDDPNLLALSRQFMPGEQQSMLHIYAVSTGRSVADIHLFGELMQRRKSPFGLDGDELVPAGPFQHAFHFDQAKVGAYLREITAGVQLIDAEVADLRRDAETGTIEALVMTDGTELAGDFFVDCTGFRRKLIGEGMGAKWMSYQDHLPVNRAMPFWLDHDETEDIAPFTLAWAQEAGWMWAVPTRERIGCGYVYSDAFTTPDEAKCEIERALGREIEPRADLRFDSGRLDRAWIGNCLALGLSSSFLEPLEATSIHGTIVQLMLFTRFFFDKAGHADDTMRQRYNDAVSRQLGDFRDFINLHYVGERDEPFWRHARGECMNEATRDMLAFCTENMPRRADFQPFPGDLPHINEQLFYPVLDGLGHLQRTVAKTEMAASPKVRAHARKAVDAHVRDYKKAAGDCLGHRHYLDLVAEGAVSFRWQ
ncbi:tryptophan halogenase family protein [Nitratireductor alexandrii]|nr:MULTISPECIES: tryptophan halogenase family protein [Nitratireductor]